MTRAEAEGIVRAYLASTERRDVHAAQALLHPRAQLNFPRGRAHNSAEELFAASGRRYRFAGKSFDRIDIMADGPRMIVYCLGRLHGTFADGSAFEGIRFIDRFEIEDGLILRQDVWNDIDR